MRALIIRPDRPTGAYMCHLPFRGQYFLTSAQLPVHLYPNLDRDLANVVMAMCASDPKYHPTLAEMLEVAEHGVTKGWQEYVNYPRKGDEYETDEYIKKLVREYILEPAGPRSSRTPSVVEPEEPAEPAAPPPPAAPGYGPAPVVPQPFDYMAFQ